MKSIGPHEMDNNIGFLVSDISRMLSAEYNRIMKPLGLTRAQWRVVVYLHREDGLTQTELGRLLGTGKVAVGGLVKRLEHSGWVTRRSDPADKRSNRVYLTAQGRAIEADMIRTGRELTLRTLSSLSGDQRRTLTELLQSVKANLLAIETAADTQ